MNKLEDVERKFRDLEQEQLLLHREVKQNEENTEKCNKEIQSVKEASQMKCKESKILNEKTFDCKQSEQSFSRKTNLKSHMKVDHGNRNLLQCDLCDNTFEESHQLELHLMNNHDTVAKYSCDICNKHFMKKWRLEKHFCLHAM